MNGWECRGGRWFLYDARRANGRVVKEYVAGGRDEAFVRFMAEQLAERREQRAEARALVRRSWEVWRDRTADLVRPAAEVDPLLRAGAAVLMTDAGYHRPARKPWRRSRGGRDVRALKYRIDQLAAAIEKAAAQSGPLINYGAPADDPEAVAVYEAARKGDAAAVAKLPALIAGRNWVDWVGDLARQATYQVIRKAAGGDPVWQAGIEAKVGRLWADLLGPDPSPLDVILVRRVINCWVAVHALEIEQAVRPPADSKAAAYLDRRLSQAQRRLCEASRTLASVRRLNVTVVMNVAGKQQVNVAE